MSLYICDNDCFCKKTEIWLLWGYYTQVDAIAIMYKHSINPCHLQTNCNISLHMIEIFMYIEWALECINMIHGFFF